MTFSKHVFIKYTQHAKTSFHTNLEQTVLDSAIFAGTQECIHDGLTSKI